MNRYPRLLVGVLAITLSACGGDNAPPGAPPPVTQPPSASLITLAGSVSSQTGAKLAGAAVTIADGVNKGRGTTTDVAGNYSIPSVTPSGGTVQALASGFEPKNSAFANVDATLNFVLRTAIPWSQNGQGNTVFTMPTYLTRVRINGTWNRTQTSNFIVYIGGKLTVNEILRDSITYQGIHVTTGGVVEIVNSNQIAWTFTEDR